MFIHAFFSLHDVSGDVIASVYKNGERVARRVVSVESPAGVDGLPADGTLVYERVIAESPTAASLGNPVLALSLVSGHDGVRVTLDGKSAYVTPDDLITRQGYDHGLSLEALSLSLGADVPLIIALASEQLGVRPTEIASRATFHRVRTARDVPGKLPDRIFTADSFAATDVRQSIADGAHYLARGLSPDGRFRYLVDVASNKTLSGYDWPRHAGATYFLVQAAALEMAEHRDTGLRAGAARALSLLRDHALTPCGAHECIGDAEVLEIGSASLAAVAFAEAVRTGLDPSYESHLRALADTLVAAQRPDGEFMHMIHRDGTPVDVQLLYFSGEATLALARAHSVTGDARYLEAAKKGLAHLVGPAWSFFGDRYYFGEEHWTCQAMGDLWDRAPDANALDFCERWQAFGRKLQMHAGESSFDCDGAIGVGPVVTPRLTPVASRGEAGVATLDVLTKQNASSARIDPLRAQLRRGLALLMRQQFHGQYTHVMAAPDAIYGAMPGSEVDWQLRIDYVQHAGSAMVRWLEVERAKHP